MSVLGRREGAALHDWRGAERTGPSMELEAYLARRRVSGFGVYSVLLVTAIVSLGITPFVQVTRYVRALGTIRALSETQIIAASRGGFLAEYAISVGDTVRRGDTLVVLDDAQLDTEYARLQGRQDELNAYLADLRLLTQSSQRAAGSRLRLRSRRYRAELASYAADISRLGLDLEQASTLRVRAESLHRTQVITAAELEARRFDEAQATAAMGALRSRAQATWEEQASAFGRELDQVRGLLERWQTEKLQSTVLAPVDGVLQDVRGYAPGAFVEAGAVFAVLAARDSLHAELLLRPQDVPSVYPGQRGRLVVDAYPASEWNALDVVVTQVPMAADVEGNTAVYRLQASIAHDYVEHVSGRRGALLPGMTLRAQLRADRHSLWWLLTSRLRGWRGRIMGPGQVRN